MMRQRGTRGRRKIEMSRRRQGPGKEATKTIIIITDSKFGAQAGSVAPY